jgi:dihydrodipicolinate synthase/N-acetylneuraminate lyase
VPTFAGVHVALSTPFGEDGSLDLDRHRAHCAWLVERGMHGLIPCGSLGEYESMSVEERRAVVEATADARGAAMLSPGVSAPSWRISVGHTEHAASLGATGVMLLPPTNHAPTRAELRDHYAAVAAVGLPVIVYNNPFSTRIDLTPDIIAELGEIDNIVAVKEFSGDVRRVSEIIELAPHLEVLCGSDDLALESALMGAVGWIGGFTGAFPRETIEVFERGVAGDVASVLALYRAMLPALRWDSGPRFVEAIKLAIDLVGAPGGGPTRPPRRPLPPEDVATVTRQVREIIDAVGA